MVLLRWVLVDVRLAVTLWILATGSGYRGFGHLFRIVKSTCCEIFQGTIGVIIGVLLPQYFKMPSDERPSVIEGLKTKFSFLNCGVGWLIPPTFSSKHRRHHTDYHNRKGYHSIVTQVVCDHEYTVMNIVAGWPGRTHDARMLANLSIFAKGRGWDPFP